MAICEWLRCTAAATHTVEISFPDGTHQTWQVCRAHDRMLKTQVVCGRPKAASPSETPSTQQVQCAGCHRALDESPSLPEAARQPCPDCGSLDREVAIGLFDATTGREALQLVKKHADKARWITKIRTGDDYTRCLEGWGKLDRVMDRDQDLYRESIVLHDGTRLESRARLSDHHD